MEFSGGCHLQLADHCLACGEKPSAAAAPDAAAAGCQHLPLPVWLTSCRKLLGHRVDCFVIVIAHETCSMPVLCESLLAALEGCVVIGEARAVVCVDLHYVAFTVS